MADVAARRAAASWFGRPVRLSPLGDGHINDTWLVVAPEGRYVLQRLSETVFPEPRELADKVARVVEHLRHRGRIRVPALVPSRTGEAWHGDAGGGVWRLWRFVERTRTLETLNNPDQGRAAGAAFGTFQLDVADLPGQVMDPIVNFLQLPHYLAELDAAAGTCPPGAGAEAALAMVDGRRDLAAHFGARDRLIHGDCKINNLLFHHARNEVACIIDLDTVMVGNWSWDFGDLARSAAADGAEVSVERFAAIAAGFVGSGAVASDKAAEVAQALVLAPRHVALMLGVRFLTDHLRGDRYFKVRARGDNLQRARWQLALLEDMERCEQAMAAAVRRL